MAKRYRTTYSNGHTEESSSPHEARNFRHDPDGQSYWLAGKPVTPLEFYAAVDDAVDAYWTKKQQTHKPVRVLHGSSVASYVTKWVRK